MGVLISFFKWLDKLLTTALKWLVDLPGQIVLFVTTFIGVITEVVVFYNDNLPSIVTGLNNATSRVSSLGTYVSQHSAGGYLVHVLSIDVALQYVVSVGGVFCAMVSACIIAIFCYVVTAWILPMALTVAQKVIAVLSAGFVRT